MRLSWVFLVVLLCLLCYIGVGESAKAKKTEAKKGQKQEATKETTDQKKGAGKGKDKEPTGKRKQEK